MRVRVTFDLTREDREVLASLIGHEGALHRKDELARALSIAVDYAIEARRERDEGSRDV